MAHDVILDTNVLLNGVDLSVYNTIFLPVTVLEELDKIKHTSEGEKNYKARKAIKSIENADNIQYIFEYASSLPDWLDLSIPDNRILAYALKVLEINKDAIVLSGDINVLAKCKALGIGCEKFDGNSVCEDIYTGYKEVTLTEYEQSVHYQCPINRWGLLNNEYIIIKNEDGEVIDKQRWVEGKGFTPISTKNLKSIYFGDIKPKDVYQQLAIDSLQNAQITMLTGYAGTAKTMFSLGWIMQSIQSNKIGKCVIIFNPAKLKNNEQLGYYSGDRTQKLLQNSIGGILSSKLGDMTMVETLINQGKIMIVPTSDIRGIEICDNDCLYVTEAQNTDAYTIKTIIQRAKDGCKVIIEGDMEEQKDIRCSSKELGMQRVIDVFKGSPYFSCVKLQKIYRSPIAELAQNI